MRTIDFQEFQSNLEQIVDELGPGESLTVTMGGIPTLMVTGLTEEKIARYSKPKE